MTQSAASTTVAAMSAAADARPLAPRARADRPAEHSLFQKETSPCHFGSHCLCRRSLLRSTWLRWRSSIRSERAFALGVASWPNQRFRGGNSQGERFEQMFEEAFNPNDCRNSVASVASSGPIKNRMSSSRRGLVAPSARRSSTSLATASRLTKRSWLCWMSCGRASGLDEIQMVSRHRRDRTANPVTRYRKVQAGVRLAGSLASGLRRACSRLHAADLPSPSAHTSERVELSGFCHAFAWHHHLLSDRSGALSPPFTGAMNAGGVRDRGCRKGADGGSPAIPSEIFVVEYPERGVRYGSQGSRRKGRRHLGADDRSHAALSARPASFSSGDGLGIHQPGSNTSGDRLGAMTAGSGRARKRATFPAVARSFLQGASSLVARLAHNQKVVGSNPTPATNLRRAA